LKKLESIRDDPDIEKNKKQTLLARKIIHYKIVTYENIKKYYQTGNEYFFNISRGYEDSAKQYSEKFQLELNK
jgi:hypothetical protein